MTERRGGSNCFHSNPNPADSPDPSTNRYRLQEDACARHFPSRRASCTEISKIVMYPGAHLPASGLPTVVGNRFEGCGLLPQGLLQFRFRVQVFLRLLMTTATTATLLLLRRRPCRRRRLLLRRRRQWQQQRRRRLLHYYRDYPRDHYYHHYHYCHYYHYYREY